ncbi:MAG: apolipoprotein N-acyltransferase [Treponemataceae bacterium]|nr:apolipoprotein N-acyltransferase [Treponemataceae bacterium]
MKRFLQVFYVIFSAALLSLAIPNELFHFGSPFLAPAALVPLYIACSRFSSYTEAALLTGMHAMCVHLLSSYWLAFFKDFAAFTLGASALGTGAIGAVFGLALYLPSARETPSRRLEHSSVPSRTACPPFRAFWFAAVYTLYEWVKSCGFLGYPWGTVSSAMIRWRLLIQIADITGTYGVTFLAALFAAAAGEGLSLLPTLSRSMNARMVAAQYARTAAAFCALLSCTFLYGAFRYLRPGRPVKYLNAVLVQQNADPWQQSSDNPTILVSQKLTEDRLEEARRDGKTVDLVVWSEGCLKYSFPRAASHYAHFPAERPLIPFIQECGVPFLLGGSYRPDGQDGAMNAALLFDGGGNFRGAYGKNHLVPFAEVVPFASIPAVSGFLKKAVGISAGWMPGDQYVYFDVRAHNPIERRLPPVKVISLAQTAEEQEAAGAARPFVRLCAPICFDDAFPDVCRPFAQNGAELFMNITDDSWSRTKSSEYQHFAVALYRAVELRTTLARSCNSGYSAVIDPAGRIVADMPLFEEASLFCHIPIYNRKATVYLRLGNWLPYTILALVLAEGVRQFLARNSPDEVPSERGKLEKIAAKLRRRRRRRK